MSASTIIAAGVDVGSSAAKFALVEVDAHGPATILALHNERIRRRELRKVIRDGYDVALQTAGVQLKDVAYTASTGEGELVDFRSGHFYGMTTHARGAVFLMPGATAVIDIGALHTRAICIDERSHVLNYRMTNQCASGSGQFLENVARYLGILLEDVGPLSCEAKNPEPVSSICAVLAETDVINMVSRGIARNDILKGIHLSMAGRNSSSTCRSGEFLFHPAAAGAQFLFQWEGAAIPPASNYRHKTRRRQAPQKRIRSIP